MRINTLASTILSLPPLQSLPGPPITEFSLKPKFQEAQVQRSYVFRTQSGAGTRWQVGLEEHTRDITEVQIRDVNRFLKDENGMKEFLELSQLRGACQ